MATHISILAWRLPRTEEPDGLQSMGLQSWTWLSDQHLYTYPKCTKCPMLHMQIKTEKHSYTLQVRLFWWLSSKESASRCRKCGFNPWVWKIPWRRKWLPTLVFLPVEFHGQRSLESYSPWGCKELNTAESLTHTHTHTHNSMFNILRIFQSGYMISHFYQQCINFQFLYILTNTCYHLFENRQPSECDVVSHCSLDLHFPKD